MYRFLPAVTIILVLVPGGQVQGADAARILQETGTRGGMVVHLGCGSGELTAALRRNGSYTVHGLDNDADNIRAARRHIRSRKLYGDVSVEQFDGAALPYADNLINLIVVDDPGAVPTAEIMRVLAPNGVACVKGNAGYSSTRKPRPGDIDEWTHHMHDAGNNAVARDLVVGPPRRIQWVAPPLWLRSHETPSGFQGHVAGGGRVFNFFDEGIIGLIDYRFPCKWSLIARDAFNGKLLWRRELPRWGWRAWTRSTVEGTDATRTRALRVRVPTTNFKRMVVQGDRLLVALGYGAPLSILDAATGETLTVVKGTEGMSAVKADNGVAVVLSPSDAPTPTPQEKQKKRPKKKAPRKGGPPAGNLKLSAVAIDSGKVLWAKEASGLRDSNLCMKDDRLFFVSRGAIVCADQRTGKEIWSRKGASSRLSAYGDKLFAKGRNTLAALNAATGKELWNVKTPPGGRAHSPYITRDAIWFGAVGRSDVKAVGLDLETGEKIKEVTARQLFSTEHHHRCYDNRATERYIISGMEGAEFLDLIGDNHSQNNWLRGACKQGILPCNGLLYVPPDQCFCEPGGKLLGYCAVAPAAEEPPVPVPDGKRLVRGPAYGRVKGGPAAAADWPTYRHDGKRWGSTSCKVGSKVKTAWSTVLGGKLTAPVAVGDRLFIAEMDRHTLHALDARNGGKVWSYTAGGRIDSPPTIYNGLCLFGGRDGYVYCLRASDGELVWRFMAARHDRRIGFFDQFESAWPVHGSVLVRDGKAYFCAGRSTYVDGGIYFYALDPTTGRILNKGRVSGPHARTGEWREKSFFVHGANSEVLVSEGDFVYMRQKKLTPDLKEVKVPDLSSKGESDVGLHLFSTASLLDGSWYNRTFWMYAKRWPGFQLANQSSKAGQLIVVDDTNTYALRVFYRRNCHSPFFFPGKEGYLIFADRNTNEPQIVGEDGAKEPLEWLPQSSYERGRGKPAVPLNMRAFGSDKGIGYTRAAPPLWKTWVKVRVRAMVKAGDDLFAAGPPDEFDADDPFAPFEGRRGAVLVALSAADGKKLSEMRLPSPPVIDGMIAAGGALYMACVDGSVVRLSR